MRIQIEKQYWLHYEQLKKMKRVEIDVYLRKLQSIEISILLRSVWGCILQQSGKAMTKLCAVYVDFYTAVKISTTKTKTSIPNHKYSAEQKVTEIKNQESVPLSSDYDISRHIFSN